MTYDGILDVAIGLSSTSKVWKNTKMKWSSLVQKLSEPINTGETYEQYIKASKDEQNKIKDVGGYFGGYLKNGRRQPENVETRQLLYLDIDYGHLEFWDDFLLSYDNAAVLHSTKKHTNKHPRYRLVMPLNRQVKVDEYEAIARYVAGSIDIELFDNSTFQSNRFMYWPSVCSDSEFVLQIQDGAWLNADSILASYKNWQDTNEWPKSKANSEAFKSTLSKQEDPLSKSGIVGVFCRTYTITEAIEEFLSDIYVPSINGRYTYTKGSTGGGAVIYDDKFLFSHHSTDPCSNRLSNAFDLVRIHKFGHLDSGTQKEKNDPSAKSYKLMEAFCTKDAKTKITIANEKLAEARFEFADADIKEAAKEPDLAWTAELEANYRGVYENSANNINTILKHDEYLKNAFKLNLFDNKRYVFKSLPWRTIKEPELMRDVDYSGIRNYIESVYGISASGKIDDALALEFERASFHPIRDYITSLKWDNENRIETLLIDYFGAEDNGYTRAAAKKFTVGAVARVFEPGVKFDLMLTLVGPQSTYKSTFVKKLGRQWFSDTFITVQGKEAFEQIQGAWIIEVAELSGLKKAEVEATKHFISKTEDMFRPAYGRTVETYKRQCVFVGTTNNENFLRDPTGNRRFMPTEVNPSRVTKSVKDDLDDETVDQIWAEAYQLYKNNELLYFVYEEEQLAKQAQTKHYEVDERKGIIQDYLDRLLPEDWPNYSIEKRLAWLLDDDLKVKGKIERMYVCVAEIWCECLGKDKSEMSRYNTREINEVMKSLSDWEFINSTKNFSIYGTQKYYARKID